MQALILAGGEGTRLRPLTSTMPKPVVPLVDRPFIVHMLGWLRSHGIDDVVLSCGFMADEVRAVLGFGGVEGLRLRYVDEPRALGTAGAVKFAEDFLEERFFVLNGDILTDIDLSAQLAQHEERSARVTIALVEVEDPSAYGLVPLHADKSVAGFIEKPGSERAATNLINAGAYILERDLLGQMGSRGTNVSIEREVFPGLVGGGLFGYVASGYWLDIGTPARYLQGTYDILEGKVRIEASEQLDESGVAFMDAVQVDGRVVAPAVIGAGSWVGAGASVGSRTVLGPGVTVGAESHIEGSVVMASAKLGAHSTITSSILGPGVSVGDRCHVEDGVVLGEGVKLGSGNILTAGARIFPGVELPDDAIKF